MEHPGRTRPQETDSSRLAQALENSHGGAFDSESGIHIRNLVRQYGSFISLGAPPDAFPAPKPFALRSLSGDLHILGGEPTLISIQAYPEEPDSVYIKLTRKQSSFIPDDSTAREAERIITTARDSTDLFRFPLQDIYRDYTYQAFVKAQHFWEPWREIHSPEHEIVVTDRPGMEKFEITVIPPAYSGLESQSQSGNQANVEG